MSQSAVAEQQSTRAEALTIGVTVDPICTVAITAAEFERDDAIDVNCRNLRYGQPAPLVSVPADGPSSDDDGIVVIHF